MSRLDLQGRARPGRWLAAAFFLATASAAAQPGPAPPAPAHLVRVGDGTMQGARIRPYDNVWLVVVRRNDGSVDERGLSSDHVRLRDIGGRRYLTRIEGTTAITGRAGQPPDGGFSMTFNVFDPVTMAPLRGESRDADGSSMFREFDGTHVVTRTTAAAGAAAERTEFTLPNPAFDFHGGMTGLLLAALPLRVGYTAAIPGIGDTNGDVTPIRVLRQEMVAAGRLGRVRAWVVQIGDSPRPTLYWISPNAPYVIKVVVTAPGGTASWEMI